MGTGDWNDGMSLVGAEGKGESVWLGWFIVSILGPFADLAETRGQTDRATRYRRVADTLTRALDKAWDGDWYHRAYFDDGTPLGSKTNTECQIDAIAQSWSVISGAGEPERAKRAMQSVNEKLVREEDGIVLLLTPPFDTMEPSPGYIRGYLPGVRENGGQYTHAALWNVLAFAQLGDGDRAAELFALLNPVNHGRTAEEVARYRAEPYVVAADVYSVRPTPGAAGGRGTPARPDGCIASASKPSWGSRSGTVRSISTHASHADGRDSRPPLPATTRATASSLRIPTA